MKRLILVFVFALSFMLVGRTTFPPKEVHASNCPPSPYQGTWENNSDVQLVFYVQIHIPCIEASDAPVNESNYIDRPQPPAFRALTLCKQGSCLWDWSTGTQVGHEYVDRRFWTDASTSQRFNFNYADERLRVETRFIYGGTEQIFVDYLTKTSSNNPQPSGTKLIGVQISRVDSEFEGECLSHEQEFYSILEFSGGTYAYKRTGVVIEQQSGYITPILGDNPWELEKHVPIRMGTVDIFIKLMEEDPWLCGSDQVFDINPHPDHNDIHLLVGLETGSVWLDQAGEWEFKGNVGKDITLEGLNGENKALITFRITRRPSNEPFPGLPIILQRDLTSVASPPTSTVNSRHTTESVTSNAGTIATSESNSLSSTSTACKPEVVNLNAREPKSHEDQNISFVLEFSTSCADEVKIYDNVMVGNSFAIFNHDAEETFWTIQARKGNECDIKSYTVYQKPNGETWAEPYTGEGDWTPYECKF